MWDTLKECIEEIAEEICGKEQHKKKQNWMTAEILHIMEERRRYKNLHTVEGDKKYKEIKHSIQKLCREAKDKYFNDKCKEIEMLDSFIHLSSSRRRLTTMDFHLFLSSAIPFASPYVLRPSNL